MNRIPSLKFFQPRIQHSLFEVIRCTLFNRAYTFGSRHISEKCVNND